MGREEEIKQFDIRIVRFANEEVLYSAESVIERILEVIRELEKAAV
ncbi:MAG: hypothetical protein JKY52_18080 [Flavobacteriales bacterium]|nr:hypothetical protein [Flavobacteriales bacterium]